MTPPHRTANQLHPITLTPNLTPHPKLSPNRQNGRHRPSKQLPLLHRPPPLNPNLQHNKPTRELLPKILPVPRPDLAAAKLRRGRASARRIQVQPRRHRRQCLRRVSQGRWIRACKDGGGAHRRLAAWSYYQSECYADASEVGDCGEVNADES